MPDSDAIEQNQFTDAPETVFHIVPFDEKGKRKTVFGNAGNGHAAIPPGVVIGGDRGLIFQKIGGSIEQKFPIAGQHARSVEYAAEFVLHGGIFQHQHRSAHGGVSMLGC